MSQIPVLYWLRVCARDFLFNNGLFDVSGENSAASPIRKMAATQLIRLSQRMADRGD